LIGIEKPKLRPKYACPPGNTYVVWDARHDRYEITYAACGGRNLGFKSARDLDAWLRAAYLQNKGWRP